VTIERVTPLRPILRALRAHRHRPIVRIVFQAGRGPAYYQTAVKRIGRDANVLGELLDSDGVRATSRAEVRARAQRFVNAFGSQVDVWEVGNELNGEWLGNPRSIIAKAAAAYGVITSAGQRTAITLNYWPSHNCYAHRWERPQPFARRLPARIRHGVDYLLLSFYETACRPPAHPTVGDFTHVFRRLKRVFPHSQVGMGEIGAQRASDGVPKPTLREKKRIASTYYGMQQTLANRLGPRFVGGYFWWYYAQDAVPRRRPHSLWPTLERLFNSY
jgi:hypothetical protein